MAKPDAQVTDRLLSQAGHDDPTAAGALLDHFRPRLRRMIHIHLDRRLAARVDPSDIIQESLLDASQRLKDYLRQRPMPFYPWLRQIAWQRLCHCHQQHLRTHKRSVAREMSQDIPLPDVSFVQLADRLVDTATTPSAHLMRDELQSRVRDALSRLPPADRQLLVLRYLEQLHQDEIAAILNITPAAVSMRQLRALERLRAMLNLPQDR